MNISNGLAALLLAFTMSVQSAELPTKVEQKTNAVDALQYDIAEIPFSRFGSYLSMARMSWGEQGDALYLNTHHGKSGEAFRIDPFREGRKLEYKAIATPSRLVLKPDGGGEVEFVFSGTKGIRVRGKGVSLRFEMSQPRARFAYQLPDGIWAFNMSDQNVQFAFEKIKGSISIDAPWVQGKGFCYVTSRMVAVLEPDSTGRFEAAIDEFISTWVKPVQRPFEACRDEVEKEYALWTKGLPEVSQPYAHGRDIAAYVNWSATVNPSGNLTRKTMFMSKVGMCNIYAWDNVFNAMAHCRHDPDLAWHQFMVMTDKIDAYGKCPANMNEKDIMLTLGNSPVYGWAFQKMWKDNPAMMTPQRLAEAYDYLSKSSLWWSKYRTWPGDVLPYYVHGFEGWDNSTIFDEGVPIVSPDLAAYLVVQSEVLSEIARALKKDSEAVEWHRKSEELLAALVKTLWKEDHFVGILRPSGKTVECESLITCMPMILGRRLPDSVQKALVQQIRGHVTPWGLASEKLTSSKYAVCSYWRGPVWAPTTMIVVTGLADIGETELVKAIARGFCSACLKSGFYENFDAKTGEGHYNSAYTWTSSVYMIFASQYCGD